MHAETASFTSPGRHLGSYPELLDCSFTVIADEPVIPVFDGPFEIIDGDTIAVCNDASYSC